MCSNNFFLRLQTSNAILLKQTDVDHLKFREVAKLGRVDPGDLVVGHVQGDQRGQGGGQAELWQGVSGNIQDLDREVKT